MKPLLNFWNRSSLYLRRWFYISVFSASALFMLGFFINILVDIASIILLLTIITALVEALLLYSKKQGISAYRTVPDRMSNGDENKIVLHLKSNYSFGVDCFIIDELPFQFEARDWNRNVALKKHAALDLPYTLRPLERGIYEFGNINIFISGPLKMIRRRISFAREQEVKVYPSFLQMKRHDLQGVADQYSQTGSRRMRTLGSSLEFEQIKEYVRGDDYRTINWKATARRGDLMINNYTDEKSQQVYCLINKGRTMKMPFKGLTLLDYAINSSG